MCTSLAKNGLLTAINKVISVSYLAQKYLIFSLTKHFLARVYPTVHNRSHIRPTYSERVLLRLLRNSKLTYRK